MILKLDVLDQIWWSSSDSKSGLYTLSDVWLARIFCIRELN